MNAIELADQNELYDVEKSDMLRRQHEAIKVLREALAALSWYAHLLDQIVYPPDEQDIDHEIQAKAKQALKDTEEFK